MPDLTPSALAQLRGEHRGNSTDEDGTVYCSNCGEEYPCAVVVLCDEVERLWAERPEPLPSPDPSAGLRPSSSILLPWQTGERPGTGRLYERHPGPPEDPA